MGTHPIFESDFDCLTEWWNNRNVFHRTGLDRFNMTGGFIWWTMKILTVLIIICNGSPGDRSSWYRSCFAKCTSENCDGVSELPAYSFPLTSLPCPLRCKAKCIESTHEIIKTKWQKQERKLIYLCFIIFKFVASQNSNLSAVLRQMAIPPHRAGLITNTLAYS